MHARRLIEYAFLLYFLCMTGYAFWYTMMRTELSVVPWEVLRFHYGMMAPYQGYSVLNADLLAEGQREDDVWETIDLDPYYPMLKGHQIMHRRLRSFSFLGVDAHRQAYDKLAKLLLQHEERHGNRYAAIRLTWQEWPKSPESFESERKPENITNYTITSIVR